MKNDTLYNGTSRAAHYESGGVGGGGGGGGGSGDLLAGQLSNVLTNREKWYHDVLAMILWPAGWENDTGFGSRPNIRPPTSFWRSDHCLIQHIRDLR